MDVETQKRKLAREDALIAKFTGPPTNDKNFKKQAIKRREYLRLHHSDRNPFRFSTIPEWMRPVAEKEFERLLKKAKAQGKEITQHKIASLIANATFIARDVRCTRAWQNKCFQYLKERAHYRKLMAKRADVVADRIIEMKNAGMERSE